MLISNITNTKMGNVYHKVVNAHIYANQKPGMDILLTRDIINCKPELIFKKDLNTLDDLMNVTVDDFEVIGYKSHESIKFPFAV